MSRLLHWTYTNRLWKFPNIDIQVFCTCTGVVPFPSHGLGSYQPPNYFELVIIKCNSMSNVTTVTRQTGPVEGQFLKTGIKNLLFTCHILLFRYPSSTAKAKKGWIHMLIFLWKRLRRFVTASNSIEPTNFIFGTDI